jgi:MFS family permease
MARELHATAIEAFWAGTSYLNRSAPWTDEAVSQPIFGSLSDLFCRKAFVLIFILLFCIGSLVATTTHNVFQLLLGRSLQGVGGGGIVTLTGVLIADYVPLK